MSMTTTLPAKAKTKISAFAVSKEDLPLGHPLAAIIDADFADMESRRNAPKALLIAFSLSVPIWGAILYGVGKGFHLI